MERILPTGRGRPLPIELPPVRSAADAQAAADVIMGALKEGALAAREAVDLINVVAALTRLTGALEFIKKVARMEVAKAAQTLGMDHFFAGPPAASDYARRAREMNENEPAADEGDEPSDENRYRSSQDPERVFPGDAVEAAAATPELGNRLQIVADSDAAFPGRAAARSAAAHTRGPAPHDSSSPGSRISGAPLRAAPHPGRVLADAAAAHPGNERL